MVRLWNTGGQRKPCALDDALPPGDAAYVVIDTELTGLNENRDSIVSIGAVRMTGGRISLGDPFYRLVRPTAKLTRESIVIHGLTPADLAEEQDSAAVLAEFRDYCGNDIVVGHCVAIDLEFINREMKQSLHARLENRLLDTAEVFAWMRGRQLLKPCFSSPPAVFDLYRLARCLDIPVVEAHNAAEDAFLTAQLFQRFLPLLREAGVTTIGDLVCIGDPLRGGDRFRWKGDIPNF